MNQKELIDRFSLHYEGLIYKFVCEIEGLDYKGMPEPHIPVIGSCYTKCRYKIAFYGIETAYWHSMEEFMEVAKADPKKAATLHFNDIENMTNLKWTNNFHSSFWDFIFSFLATFYKVDISDVRKGKYPDILHSFIWGNTNSIEKYSIQAEDNRVAKEVYDKIKAQSLIFDDSDHLIKIARPNVVIVLNWGEEKDWFVDKPINYNYYKINDHLWYYYNRSTQTHIFQTHHPRSLHRRYGFSEIIDELLKQFESCHIWETLPDSPSTMFVEEKRKDNRTKRNELIADIASGLIKNHSIMCGQQLVDLLNMNGIKKNNGDKYVHGRGIYKVISSAWNYYYYHIGYEQTAYNIAMSFVNSYGGYAYK